MSTDFRREILKHLNKDLIPELHYVKEMIEDNPKNYQVWYVNVLNFSDLTVHTSVSFQIGVQMTLTFKTELRLCFSFYV